MKLKRIVFCFGLLVTFGILLGSCTKESSNGQTIVPIGEEYFDVEELFSEVKPSFETVREKMGICYIIQDTIPPYFRDSIPEKYKDSIPPKIEGKYVMNSPVLVASSIENMSTDMSEAQLSFDCQHNGILHIEFTESSIQQKTDSVYLIGNKNGFTAYFIENTEYDAPPYQGQVFHVKRKRGIIMCGSVTPEGLSDFYFASIIIEMKDDSQGILPQYAPGTYVIYKEGDGLAAKSNG